MESENNDAKRFAVEAAEWLTGAADLTMFRADEEVPRAKETEMISLRMPKKQLQVLREFARRQGLGYQVLIKRWLDDRIRTEFEAMKNAKSISAERISAETPVLQFRATETQVGLVGSDYSVVRIVAPAMEAKAASFVADRPVVMVQAANA